MNPTMNAPQWGQPDCPNPDALPRTGKFMLTAIAIFMLTAIIMVIIAATQSGESDRGGSFYASAGWTVQRAADLAVTLQRDGGLSKPRADCTMKAVVGSTTWLEWRALTRAGQLALIREAAC